MSLPWFLLNFCHLHMVEEKMPFSHPKVETFLTLIHKVVQSIWILFFHDIAIFLDHPSSFNFIHTKLFGLWFPDQTIGLLFKMVQNKAMGIVRHGDNCFVSGLFSAFKFVYCICCCHQNSCLDLQVAMKIVCESFPQQSIINPPD